MELLVFSSTLGQYGGALHENAAVIANGRISVRDDKDPQMVLNRVVPLEQYADSDVAPALNADVPPARRTLYLKAASQQAAGVHKLVPILHMFPGRTRTVIYFADTGVRLGGSCDPQEIMLAELRELLGENNVVLK